MFQTIPFTEALAETAYGIEPVELWETRAGKLYAYAMNGIVLLPGAFRIVNENPESVEAWYDEQAANL